MKRYGVITRVIGARIGIKRHGIGNGIAGSGVGDEVTYLESTLGICYVSWMDMKHAVLQLADR
jgi:hypothetical protein